MMSRRDGFTILEVVISIVMLGIVMTTLGGLTYSTAQRAVSANRTSQRQAYSLETVNRMVALPWASLTGASGCDTVGTTNNQYQRCVTVMTSGPQRTVIVKTTPLNSSVAATTFRIVRAAPSPANPLCSGC